MQTGKRRPRSLSPDQEAELAGLVYVSADGPGYMRRRCGRGFRYVDSKGVTVRQGDLIQRFRSLVIPPAWEDVWICEHIDGHLQVTGRDERGRKQYRYHERWRQQRDETKFERMRSFGHSLPMIRREMEACLKGQSLSKRQVVATVVYLLEKTLIRVGNESYAQANDSYGLTTMRDHHVDIEKATLSFEFRGKSGIEHKLTLRDPKIAKIVERCQDLPGQILFQYRETDGSPHPIGSSDVNLFLKEVSGESFSAKDFRTWHASVRALKLLKDFPPPMNKTQAQRFVKRAISEVAEGLRNTVTICRKSYVHPLLIEAYVQGSLARNWEKRAEGKIKAYESMGLSRDEAAFLCFLEKPVGLNEKNRASKRSRELRRSA